VAPLAARGVDPRILTAEKPSQAWSSLWPSQPNDQELLALVVHRGEQSQQPRQMITGDHAVPTSRRRGRASQVSEHVDKCLTCLLAIVAGTWPM
jgi:hypothetical protein